MALKELCGILVFGGLSVACGEGKVQVYTLDSFPKRAIASSVQDGRRVAGSEPDEIRSWLLLRQAASTSDSATRAELYSQITLPVARDRIPWVEADTREQLKDYTGALNIYRTIEAPISRFRMRYEIARSSQNQESLDSIRAELLDFIRSSSTASLVREAYQVFDKHFPRATPEEEHAIARAAADIGAWARAEQGFAQAAKASLLTSTDRFRYGTALHRLRQYAPAAAQYAKVTTPRSLVAAARYQRARTFVARGEGTEARRQLRSIEDTYGTDTSAAAALSLFADLEGDVGRDETARTVLREIVRRFPVTRFARAARINIAMTSYVLGEYKTASTEFSALLQSADSVMAQYWLGRTRARLGDTRGAETAWRAVLRRDSLSYYGALAARRLDTKNIHDISDDSVRYPTVPVVDSAVRRIALLRARGMDQEIRYENDRLFRDATLDRDRLLATAAAFANTDQAGRAIALGRRALNDYGPSFAIYRLIYPLAERTTIIRNARQAGLDPVIIAALIRQESNFNPRAISPVGARGLMQLMPTVAAGLARQRGIGPWSNARLDDPAINIVLGIAHLAPSMRKHTHMVRALAAYNAGESRVTRWVQKTGADDPELFTERIPFSETRDYVKSILRNREFYRALYAWQN